MGVFKIGITLATGLSQLCIVKLVVEVENNLLWDSLNVALQELPFYIPVVWRL